MLNIKTELCVILLYILFKSCETECHCGFGSYCGVVENNDCLCGEISGGLYTTPALRNEKCKTLMPHCTSSSCLNNAVCHNTFGSFYCACTTGFHGQNCEKTASTLGARFVQNVMVYYDIHEAELNDGITFLVIIKQFGDNYEIELDDGNGHIFDTSSLNFKLLNPNIICEHVTKIAVEADPKICSWIPKRLLNVGKIKLYYPYENDKSKAIYTNQTLIGRKDTIKLTIKNSGEIEFYETYPVFTPLIRRPTSYCTLAINLRECSSDSKNPFVYGRSEEFIIRGETKAPSKGCKFVTEINYYWQVLGPSSYKNSFKGQSSNKFRGKDFNPGLYTVVLQVDVFGKYLVGQKKRHFWSAKKCWFKINWENVVPILKGGKRRVETLSGSFKLDASPSIDPNFNTNKYLRYSWYCKTNHSICNFRRDYLYPIIFITMNEIGSFEMFLQLRSAGTNLPYVEISQIVDLVQKTVIEGFEIICYKNCINTRSSELTYLQLNIFPSNEKVIWTYRKDGGPETSAASLTQSVTPDNVLIIANNVLSPGSEYIVKAQIDATFNEILLITSKPPTKGICQINPIVGEKIYTKFQISCSGYQSLNGKPLKYNIYQKMGSPGQQNEFEDLLAVSTQSPVITNLQFIRENILIKVSNDGGSQTEELKISLEEQIINDVKIDNLVYKVQDNIRNREIAKGITSVYALADKINLILDKSKIVDVLIKTINKIPILEVKDAEQVTAALHFLSSKTVGEDVEILPSIAIKTAAQVLDKVCTTLKQIDFGHIDFNDLLEVARSIFGIVNSLLECRHQYTSNDSEHLELYQRSYFDFQDASNTILFVINNISYVITSNMVPHQPPVNIEHKNLISQIFVDSVDQLVKLDKIDPSKGGAAYMKFDEKLADSFKGKTIELQITEFKKNLFWWAETEYSMNSDHLNVKLNVRNEIGETFLKHPIHLFMEIHISPTEILQGEVQQPPKSLSLYQKDLSVKVIKIERKKGTGGTFYIEFIDLGTSELEVIILIDQYPDYDLVRRRGAKISLKKNFYKTRSLSLLLPDSIIYLGIIPGLKHSDGEIVKFKYVINDHLCRVWSKEYWDIQSCEVGPQSTGTVVHCQCKHLSMFGASLLIAPNEVQPVQDIALLLNLKDNPYIFSMVICILIIFFCMFIWAKKMDKKDKHERSVHFLSDNLPGESHGYLLVVFTGEKPLSGTTAKVGIRIHGKNGVESHSHILNHDKDTLQLAQDNWFLIFTIKHLGDIDYLHIWHDNSGASPDWNCKKIVLYDLTVDRQYIFLVDDWLSVNYVGSDWKLEWKLKPVRLEEGEWQDLAKENFYISLRESHLWVSIFVRHPRSAYTRLQRLTVAMSVIMVSMLTALMFYGADERMDTDDPTFNLTVKEIIVSIECALISVPISLVIAKLFSCGRQKSYKQETKNKKLKKTLKEKATDLLKDILTLDPLLPVVLYEDEILETKDQKSKRKIYLTLAWVVSFVVIFVSCFFIMLYGLRLGPNKSLVWVSVTILRLIQAVVIIQPLRLIIYSLLITFMFKETRRNQMLYSVENIGTDSALKDDSRYMSKLMDLRSKPMYKPLREIEVMIFSKRRQKVEESNWNIVNFIFVSVLYVSLFFLISGSNSDTLYYHTQHLIDLIRMPTTKNDYDVDEVLNTTRFYEYIIKTLLPSLHTIKWYNDMDLTVETEEIGRSKDKVKGWTNDFSNKLLGAPRMRQLRITNDTCTVPKLFQKLFSKCNSSYSSTFEDKKDYEKRWNSIDESQKNVEHWEYFSPTESETTGMYGVSGNFYPGGGYIKNLTNNLQGSVKEVSKLKLRNWFDELTRVVFIEFNLYCVYSNLFSQVTIIVENLASGVVVTRVCVGTSYQQFYAETLDLLFLVAFIFFILVLLLSIVRIIIHVSIQGAKSFFNSFENFIDLLLIFFGVCSVIAFLMRVAYFKLYSDRFEQTNNDAYISFSYPFYQQDLGSLIIGILVVLTTIRLLQLAYYGKYFYILYGAVKEAGIYILFILCILFLFTLLLSLLTYLTETQKTRWQNILPVSRINFINYEESFRIDTGDFFFKVTLNLMYITSGMLLTAVFIFFYAKLKFDLLTVGRVEGYSNHFIKIMDSCQKGLIGLIRDNVKKRIHDGTATGNDKNKYRKTLYVKAKKKVSINFQLHKREAENIMRDFTDMSKRHKKMCEQLDLVLKLI